MESERGEDFGDGGYGLPRALCALAMTLVFHGGAVCGGAHGPRPTRAFARIVGGQGRPPLRITWELMKAKRRGNRRSAASGRQSVGTTVGNRRPLRMSYKKCGWAGRCGERTERCRWQRKRSERVAAVKILSDSRKAAQKFWAPQQGHRPLRGEFGENKRKKQEDTEVSSCF